MKENAMNITVLGLCGNSVFLSVDHFHAPGETVQALGLYSEPGGKGYNQAVAAARLGAQVSFLTCIGDDSDGKVCMDFLEQEGVQPLPTIDHALATAYACICTDREGDNRVTVYRGAADNLSPEFVFSQEKTIANSQILLLNNEYPQSCNEAAMILAKKYGIKVIYNPAPARPVSREFLEGCYLVTPNLSETGVLVGKTGANLSELPDLLRKNGIRRAVVTLGGDGALLVSDQGDCLIPARKTRAVDTTGAGDTFTAALSVALLLGKDLTQSARWATHAAALSVAKKYVMPSLPTWEELEADIQKMESEMI